MNLTEWKESLSYVSASRKNRAKHAQFLLKHPELMGETLEILFQVDDPVSVKAAWIIEFAANQSLTNLIPHIDYYITNIPSVYLEKATRPVAKISALICEEHYKNKAEILKSNHLKILTETCFDWLLSTHKVAVKVHAMQCLYYLGLDIPWIHTDLKEILEKNYAASQPAYKARSRFILKKLPT